MKPANRRDVIAIMAAALYKVPMRFKDESISQARLRARQRAIRTAALLYRETHK